MSKPTLLIVTALCAVLLTVAQAGTRVTRQTIPREFQNINIENYLKNPRAVQFQLKCVIYDGPCDRIGKYLKVSIPELLTNQCRNCQPEQRKQTGRLVAFLQQNYPKEWEDAIKKFQGGRRITGDEVKRFEQEFGIKADAVSTVAPPSAELANAEITTIKPVSAAEAADIIKGFGAQYLEEQKKLMDAKKAGVTVPPAAAAAAPAPAAPAAAAPAPAAPAAPAAAAPAPAAKA